MPRMTPARLVAAAAPGPAAAAAAAAVYHCSSPGERSKPGGKEEERIYGHRPGMATQTTASCTGSTLLQPLSEIINLPLDQVCVWMEKISIHEATHLEIRFTIHI